MSDRPKWLHVYGQHIWHDDVYIVGDLRALTTLRDAIDQAITDWEGETGYLFTSDGEGYRLRVARVGAGVDFGLLLTPYSDPMARDHRRTVILPDQCFSNTTKNTPKSTKSLE